MRLPELSLGVLLVVGGALGAVLWHASLTSDATVVVAARDLPKGHVIGPTDLRAATVQGATGLALLPGEEAHRMLGRTLLADVPAAAPLVPSLGTERPALASDEALVSVALAAGHAPAELAPLDLVRVVVVTRDQLGAVAQPELVEHLAEVWSVAVPGEFDPTTLVTLRAPLELATAVAAADHVRLAVIEPVEEGPQERTQEQGP